MRITRRKFIAKFKVQEAIVTIKKRESLTKQAKPFELHPNQI
jgi:hypothetical protein